MLFQPTTISSREYLGLDAAFGFFNRELFANTLPDVLITLNRKRGAAGYFHNEIFQERDGNRSGHEIALNPDTFRTRTDKEILSTLVHEMVHLWQAVYGKQSRKSYHNRQWAIRMEEAGLIPSDTGKVGGKKTGQSMSHYVEPGGAFDVACDQLLLSGVRIGWESKARPEPKSGPKDYSKVRFCCSTCGMLAWANHNAILACGHCLNMDHVSYLNPPGWEWIPPTHLSPSLLLIGGHPDPEPEFPYRYIRKIRKFLAQGPIKLPNTNIREGADGIGIELKMDAERV